MVKQDNPIVQWEGRTLLHDEFERYSSPVQEPELIDASTEMEPYQGRTEETPSEFEQLYAALERRTEVMDATTLMDGAPLGAGRPYVLGVTSAVPGEGKTSTALHLAMTIARQTFKRVCLVDMSLGEDEIRKRLGLPDSGKGVIGVLEEAQTVVPTVQLQGCDNLVVIPAGKVPVNPGRLARSPRAGNLVISARTSFDITIVDLPAISTGNALPLARLVDGLLFVTRAGATPRDVTSRAIEAAGREKVVGVVLNRVKSSLPAWLLRRFQK